MQKASKTIKAIETALYRDQGAAFRQNLKWLMPKMDDAYRGESDGYRNHLGASLIGKECAREIWYGYRWAQAAKFEGKMLRLFNRGHLEEARFLSMLITAGFEIWFETPDGGQMRFSDLSGHFGSALDGVVKGLPELPQGAPAYTEFKTANDKSFARLAKNGMRNEKYEHFVQMQICMKKMDLQFGVYLVINKNTDALYGEIIELEEHVFESYLHRANIIIQSDEPPPKINESPGWWKCKFCSKKGICHEREMPDINCRTCAHSYPVIDGNPGQWGCVLDKEEITKCPAKGCQDHVYNPYMLGGVQFHGGNEEQNCTDITLPNGDRLLQGPHFVTSQQLKDRGLK